MFFSLVIIQFVLTSKKLLAEVACMMDESFVAVWHILTIWHRQILDENHQQVGCSVVFGGFKDAQHFTKHGKVLQSHMIGQYFWIIGNYFAVFYGTSIFFEVQAGL